MSAIGVIAIVLSVLGATCVVAVVGQLWAVGGRAEDPVGSWHARRPDPIPEPMLPRELRSLIHGEAQGWHRIEQWQTLTMRLDTLEVALGGIPHPTPPPEEYEPAWLDERIMRLEELSGPLPSPMEPIAAVRPSRPKRFWNK